MMALFPICFLPLWFIGPRLNLSAIWPVFWRRTLVGIALAVLTWLICSSLAYVALPIFYDHAETQVASIAAHWLRGGHMYHGVDSGFRYSTNYGPVPILCAALFMSIFSNPIAAAKLSGLACLAITMTSFCTLINLYARSRRELFVGIGTFGLMLLGFGHISYWIRPDSYMLAIVALSLVISEMAWPIAVSLVIEGVLAGLIINCKVYGALLFIPIFFYWLEAKKPKLLWWHLPLGSIGFFAALSIPFLAPRVSGAAFLQTVKMGLHQHLLIDQGLYNLTLVAAPLIVLVMFGFHRRRPLSFYSLVATSLLIDVFSAKPGSGAHLYLPLFAMTGLYIFQSFVENLTFRHANVALIALAVTLTFSAYNNQKKEVFYLGQIAERYRELADLRGLIDGETGPIEMGYADESRYVQSAYKTFLVNKGHGLFIDSAALMEMEFSGFGMPESTYEILESCRIQRMILPDSSNSWKLTNWYYGGRPLFSDRWRQVFSRHYKVVRSSKFFDLWECSPSAPGQH